MCLQSFRPAASKGALLSGQLIDPSATFGAALAAARAGDKDAYAWLRQLAPDFDAGSVDET